MDPAFFQRGGGLARKKMRFCYFCDEKVINTRSQTETILPTFQRVGGGGDCNPLPGSAPG